MDRVPSRAHLSLLAPALAPVKASHCWILSSTLAAVHASVTIPDTKIVVILSVPAKGPGWPGRDRSFPSCFLSSHRLESWAERRKLEGISPWHRRPRPGLRFPPYPVPVQGWLSRGGG